MRSLGSGLMFVIALAGFIFLATKVVVIKGAMLALYIFSITMTLLAGMMAGGNVQAIALADAQKKLQTMRHDLDAAIAKGIAEYERGKAHVANSSSQQPNA